MFQKLCFSLFFVSIFMVVGCGISGTAVDQDGDPIAGVEVTLDGPTPGTATTDISGQYSFGDLMPGNYVVSADLSDSCGVVSKNVSLLQSQEVVNFKYNECLTGRFVATDGIDEGTCDSPSAPCKTINYAVSQSTAGDDINVAAGTYAELVILDATVDGLNFKGANVGRAAGVNATARIAETVVKGFRSPPTSASNPHPSSAYELSVSIDGFTINAQGDLAQGGIGTGGTYTENLNTVHLFGGSSVTIQNNIFIGGTLVPTCGYSCTDMFYGALQVNSGTFLISENSFTNFRQGVALPTDGADPIVSGTVDSNTFNDVTNAAIQLWNFTGSTYPGVTITNNQVAVPNVDQTAWGVAGITSHLAGSNTISDNTFTGVGSAIFTADDCSITGGLGANSITDNNFYNNGRGIQYAPSCATQVDDVITDNNFVGNEIGVRAATWNGGSFTSDINAECNWWGATGGPGSSGTDTITSDVDADPWNTAIGGPCDGTTP